ncbi:MAG: hypothetical protein L3J35_09355 [Bacteroidales bacterium]|nr:hypothetical protein [Bacteroidales bacterium]
MSKLDDWEKVFGFTSVRMIQNKFYSQLENIDEENLAEEDVVRHVKNYINFFKIVFNENGEKEIEAKIDINVLASICNVDNIFQVKNRLTKVLENDLVSSDYTEKSVLENINDDNLENLKHDNKINVFQYRGRANQKAGCGSSSEFYTILKDEKWCRKDRKVSLKFETWAYGETLERTQHLSNFARAKVQGRKKYACIWGSYKTLLDLKNIAFTVMDPYMIDYTYTTYWDEESYVLPNESIETKWIDVGVNLSKYWTFANAYYYEPYFVKYTGEFSSRGVGNEWKVGSCGY